MELKRPEEEHLKVAVLNGAAIADAMFDGLIVTDLDGNIMFVNRAMKEYLAKAGADVKKLVGKSALDLPILRPEEMKKYVELIKEVTEKETAGPLELPDATGRWNSFTASLLKDAEGNPSALFAVVRDITGRKRAEEGLVRLSNAVKMSTDSIVISDLEGKIIDVNEATLKMYGSDDKRDLIGKNSFDLIVPEDQEKAFAGMKEVLEKGYTKGQEYYIIVKDGSKIPVEMNSSIMKSADGKPIGFVGITRNITERKRAEERIEHLNAVLRAISNVSQLIARENNRDKLLQAICDSLVGTRGYYSTWIALLNESGELVTTAEAGLGKKFLPMIERLKRSGLIECGRKALRQSDVVVTEDPVSTCADCPLSANYGGGGAITIRLKHGEKVYGLISASIPRNLATDKEEQALFKEVVADIAFALHNIELEEEHKRAEETLRESEQRYMQLFEGIGDAVMVYGSQGRFLDCNKATLQRLGYSREEFLRLGAADIVHPDFHPNMKNNLKRIWAGKTTVVESAHRCKDGRTIPVEAYTRRIEYMGKPAILAVVRDITELKKAEEEKLKAAANKQRMEELEKFAKIAVGRELKMVELKERIKELELKLEGTTMEG